jgi:hypothetical protein
MKKAALASALFFICALLFTDLEAETAPVTVPEFAEVKYFNSSDKAVVRLAGAIGVKAAFSHS